MLPILGFFLTVTSSLKSKTRFLNTQVSFLDFLAEPPSDDLSSLSLWEWDAEYALGLLVLASESSQTLQMPGLPSNVFFCPPFSSYSKVSLSLLELSCLTVPALLHERTYCILHS